MTPRKTAIRTFAVLSAAALTAGVCSSAATASPMAFAELQAHAITGATQVANALGAASGGIYLENGKAVVNVVDDAAMRQVQAAGFTAKKVKHTFAALTGVKNQLDAVKNVPQTAWGIDTKTNQVVVKIYDSASKATADKVAAAAAKYGDSVRVEHRTGKLSLHIQDGDANGALYILNLQLLQHRLHRLPRKWAVHDRAGIQESLERSRST